MPLSHPPGTIVVPSGTLARYGAFSRALTHVSIPEGSQVCWVEGINVAANLNRGFAQASGEWIWILADDHVFAPDTLLRLLEHDLPMVAPVCTLRSPPHWPIVYRSESDDGSFEVWPPEELPMSGVHPVAACAMAGMVIQREALKALTPPYFEIGQIKSDELGEDLYFFHKAAQVGVMPYLDCDTRIGHITPMALWPTKRPDGGWGVWADPMCQIPTTAAV